MSKGEGDKQAALDEQQLLQLLPPEDRKRFLALPQAERKRLLAASEKEKPGASAAPPDEQQVMQLLSPEERKAYLALDPAERKLLMTASQAERDFYISLPPPENTRFAKLSPDLRAAYVRLSPPEKVLIKKLKDAEVSKYLKMSPENRRAFQGTSQVAQDQRKQAQGVASRASTVAKGAIARLEDWGQGSPELSALANSLAHNLLHGGKTDAAAQSEVLQALLNSPQLLPRLTQELADRVNPETFRRARYTLPALIAEKVQGEMTLPVIITTLVEGMGGDPRKRSDFKGNSGGNDELSDVRLKTRGGISS